MVKGDAASKCRDFSSTRIQEVAPEHCSKAGAVEHYTSRPFLSLLVSILLILFCMQISNTTAIKYTDTQYHLGSVWSRNTEFESNLAYRSKYQFMENISDTEPK